MIFRFLSRYHPCYLRSLVYMLQASEYRVGDYMKWYRRTRDFQHVERRGRLVYTSKAVALLTIAWMLFVG